LEVAGTYEVMVCRDRCDASRPEEALARGHLVLEAARYDFSDVPEPARSYIQRHEFILAVIDAERSPNACFVIENTRRAATYAGAAPVGVTKWEADSTGATTLPLFHSPDAGYIATVSIRGRELRGRGRSWGSGTGDGPIPSDSIIGRRIGPPDRGSGASPLGGAGGECGRGGKRDDAR
jgi:hypothetical protein